MSIDPWGRGNDCDVLTVSLLIAERAVFKARL